MKTPLRSTILKVRPRLIAFVTTLAFTLGTVTPIANAQNSFTLPKPTQMITLTPSFKPIQLIGLKINPQDPLRFDFIVDKGETVSTGDDFENETLRLIKYFLASITTPHQDLWVNLSPYENNRIIPPSFGAMEMGRDLLGQDYLLKQITASLIYPESDLGKAFWTTIYQNASDAYGTTNIPINTFNKVWIIPETADLIETNGTVIIIRSHLKVMLEQDYLAINKNYQSNPTDKSSIGSQLIREMVLPVLEKEINEGKNFARLRQIYNALILATWYKQKIHDGILANAYANKNKIQGLQPMPIGGHVESDVESIYQQYLIAFKKGVYNYIKDDVNTITGEIIPRKYFSGGFSLKEVPLRTYPATKAMILRMKNVLSSVLVGIGLSVLSANGQDAQLTNGPPSGNQATPSLNKVNMSLYDEARAQMPKYKKLLEDNPSFKLSIYTAKDILKMISDMEAKDPNFPSPNSVRLDLLETLVKRFNEHLADNRQRTFYPAQNLINFLNKRAQGSNVIKELSRRVEELRSTGTGLNLNINESNISVVIAELKDKLGTIFDFSRNDDSLIITNIHTQEPAKIPLKIGEQIESDNVVTSSGIIPDTALALGAIFAFVAFVFTKDTESRKARALLQEATPTVPSATPEEAYIPTEELPHLEQAKRALRQITRSLNNYDPRWLTLSLSSADTQADSQGRSGVVIAINNARLIVERQRRDMWRNETETILANTIAISSRLKKQNFTDPALDKLDNEITQLSKQWDALERIAPLLDPVEQYERQIHRITKNINDFKDIWINRSLLNQDELNTRNNWYLQAQLQSSLSNDIIKQLKNKLRNETDIPLLDKKKNLAFENGLRDKIKIMKETTEALDFLWHPIDNERIDDFLKAKGKKITTTNQIMISQTFFGTRISNINKSIDFNDNTFGLQRALVGLGSGGDTTEFLLKLKTNYSDQLKALKKETEASRLEELDSGPEQTKLFNALQQRVNEKLKKEIPKIESNQKIIQANMLTFRNIANFVADSVGSYFTYKEFRKPLKDAMFGGNYLPGGDPAMVIPNELGGIDLTQAIDMNVQSPQGRTAWNINQTDFRNVIINGVTPHILSIQPFEPNSLMQN